MPELTESSIMVRETQALSVMLIMLEDPKIKLAEACDKVGITPAVYRKYIRQQPEALEALREFIEQAQRLILWDLETAWPEIMSKLITAATAPETKAKDRVPLVKLLNRMKDDMERSYHAQPGYETDAQNFLKSGPQIHPINSRMASIEVEPTETGVRVNVSHYAEVIDGKAQDEEA